MSDELKKSGALIILLGMIIPWISFLSLSVFTSSKDIAVLYTNDNHFREKVQIIQNKIDKLDNINQKINDLHDRVIRKK